MGQKCCFFMKWLTVEFGTWGQCLSLQDEVFCLFLWYQISTSSRNAVLYCKNRWAQYREWLQPDMEVVQVITVVISTHSSIPLLLEMSLFSENCRVRNEIFMVSVVGFWDDYEWFEIIWFYKKYRKVIRWTPETSPRFNPCTAEHLPGKAIELANSSNETSEIDDEGVICKLHGPWSFITLKFCYPTCNSLFFDEWGRPADTHGSHVSVWMIFVGFQVGEPSIQVWLQLKETKLDCKRGM